MFSRVVKGAWGLLAGTGVTPDKPTLVLEVREDETGITATMSDETVGSTNNLWLMHRAGSFEDKGSDWDSVDQMDVDLTETGVYYGYIASTLAGCEVVSEIVRVVFEGPSDVQADDNIAWVLAKMTATGVYWPPNTEYDENGNPVPQQPFEISCRYEEELQEVIDSDGTVKMSKANIYADRDLKTGGIFMLGTLDDVTDYSLPKENEGAWEIIKFTKLPDINGTSYLRQAYL